MDDNTYDEDHFCYERNLKYLDIFSTTKGDVLELIYFYAKSFWSDLVETKEEYKKSLIERIENNPQDIEF
jgi:hypothetical protein